MANVRKRIERLERSLAPERNSDPHEDMKRLALDSLSKENLLVLIDMCEQGKRECEWTERESAAVKALTGAFEQEVLRAGYRSVAEFQRHPLRVPRASHRLSRRFGARDQGSGMTTALEQEVAPA
jgi:hypothetical protein